MLRLQSTFPALALTLACGAFAQSTGTPFCNPMNVNSTGLSTTLTGSFGSGVGSDLHLEVTQGVPGELAYFLAGNEVTSGVVISNGLNCLIGTGTAQMYRYDVAGSLSNSVGRFDNAGVFQNLVGTSTVTSGFDVPDTIPSGTPIMILIGDTWHFQVWHRDTPSSSGASNFSNGLSVTFPVAGPVLVAGMVSIPAGSFDMGSNATSGSPYYNSADAQPVHSVTISEAFWMGEHEVNQGEYQALMGSNPSNFSGPGGTWPVETVSWNDARAYCLALTAQEMALGNVPAGYEYRLPTEAEWEYACRAGTTTEFNVGAGLYCADARIWFSYHSSSSCGSSHPTDVGSYSANAFGLYDMHGNVFEWCLDSYASYSSGAVTDPFVTGGSVRVFRGGSWFVNSNGCRSAYRSSSSPGYSHYGIGFRVVFAQVLVP
ncbi:MAG: sulfatase activating formylglycine-generating enzyme [Planctomycetota bacterium]|jgi:formylglycine-generating enzyme required for sulfatase activity